ncbi:MAG: cytidine deaminase, partial [Tenericutes bacterium]|nr:cytidine deaminase [Mycoplasmatota bacterium]
MKEKLIKLLDNSYAPYSDMHFACIVETKDGEFYEGVNVENASYGGTICAERNAINNAISNGAKDFKALYLMTSSDNICYPCNICKQTFLEFFDEDVVFNIMTKSGKMEVMTFQKLMTTIFTKAD